MVYYTHIPISSIRPSVRAWGAVSVSAGVGSAAAASTLPTPGGFAQKASPAEWKSNLRDGGNIDPRPMGDRHPGRIRNSQER